MNVGKVFLGIGLLFVLPLFSLAQQDQFISYEVNGKKVFLTDVKLQSSEDGSFVHMEGVKRDKVDLGEGAMPRYREAEIGITIELSQEGPVVGTHVAHSSDTMPVYVTWYELKKDNYGLNLNPVLASMDSGDESALEFSVTFENFGPTGTLIKGTFFGRLLDEEGNSYQVKDGKFAIKRTDME
jgi:hypothetical protein